MKQLDRADRVGVAVTGVGAALVAAIALGGGVIGAVSGATGSTTLHLPTDADAAELVAGARWSEVTIPASLATGGERALLAAGTVIGGLTWTAIALAVAYLCWRVWAGRGFGRPLTRTIWFSAGALIVGTALSQLLTDLAANTTVDRLGLHDPVLIGFTFDAGAFGAGLALAALGATFTIGERLQRETEGLV